MYTNQAEFVTDNRPLRNRTVGGVEGRLAE